MATQYALITQNGTAGTYWANLPVEDQGDGSNFKKRYYYGGEYRVYDGMYNWHTYYDNNKDSARELVTEVQGKWDDTSTRFESISSNTHFSLTLTCKVNEKIDVDSFHYGVPAAGYRRITNERYYSTLMIETHRVSVFGLEIINQNTLGSFAIRSNSTLCTIDSCILTGWIGIYMQSTATIISNNIIRNCPSSGIETGLNVNGSLFYNNIIYGCGIGFKATPSTYIGVSGTVINNVSFGNTTNWYTGPNGDPTAYPTTYLGVCNAGETGDNIWNNDTATDIFISSANFVSPSTGNFKHAVGSPLIDAGVVFPSMELHDIAQAIRPSYVNGITDSIDVGAFEYDKGNGLKPLQVTLDISGIAEGSSLAIYKTSDKSVIVAPTTIGASGIFTSSYTFTGNTSITVKVRKGTSGTKYLPYNSQGLITSNGFSLIVSQVEDTIAND